MDPERPLGPDDVALVSELARRAAVAIDERRRRRETRELLRLFARLASGALELDHQPLSLRDVVDAAARAVAEEARAKTVAIDVVAESPGARVRGDRRRLRQLIQRVLEGALRVAPAGGRVAVRLTREDATAAVAVSAAGASSAPVTGRRLAIVRRLLALHGGRAATTRGNDRGPTLTVKLPVIE